MIERAEAMSGRRKSRPKRDRLLARALLVQERNPESGRLSLKFLRRRDIPPDDLEMFYAAEPFTVLGISARESNKKVVKFAGESASRWEGVLKRSSSIQRETLGNIVARASETLSSVEQVRMYKAYAGQYSKSVSPGFDLKRIRGKLVSCLIKSSRELKKEKLRECRRDGAIVGVSLLITLLLVVGLLIPVGGITILTFTIFSATLMASQPWLLIPALMIIPLSVLTVHWYRTYRSTFNRFTDYFTDIARTIQSFGFFHEDVVMLRGFDDYMEDPESYTQSKSEQRAKAKEMLTDYVDEVVKRLLGCLNTTIIELAGHTDIKVSEFFDVLENNHEEINCRMQEVLIETLESRMRKVVEEGEDSRRKMLPGHKQK